MKTTLIASLLLLASCGESPLFNHDTEKEPKADTTAISESVPLQFKKLGHSFTIAWIEGPRMGGSSFLLRTWKTGLGSVSGPYLDLPKNLHVYLWMPSMGHGSAPVTINKSGAGEYEVSDVQFIMGGTWEVRFQVKDGSQVLDETALTLSI